MKIVKFTKNKEPLWRKIIGRKKRLNRIKFEVHVVDHCNLNCQMCDHFSPLAQPFFLKEENFENDMKRMAELFNGEAEYVRLLGGEPLLHPNIEGFFEIARRYFKNADIYLYTNGLLLPKVSEHFWKEIKKNSIKIWLTKYPIEFDYEKVEKKLKEEKIDFYYENPNWVKTSWKLPMNLLEKQNYRRNYMICTIGNMWPLLKNGILYPCPLPPNIEHFNKYFKKEIELSPMDGIDIYRAKDANEILDFLCRPIPFCGNCNVKERTRNYKWKTSKRSLDEWS